MGSDLRLVKSFWEVVENLIPNENERNLFHDVLREYRSNFNLDRLMRELRHLVNCPQRIPLYEAVRPLIPLRHQLPYDAKALRLSSEKAFVVHLERESSEYLGFSLRGGEEHGIGFYVTFVQPRSCVWEAGIRAGDELIKVNGYSVGNAISAELADFIRSKTSLTLKLRRVGLIPRKIVPHDPLTWEHVTSGTAADDVITRDSVRVFINARDAGGVGCSIASGPPNNPGVFVRSVKVGSAAEEVGIEVGDEILEINSQELRGLSHSAAIIALKSSPHMLLTIKKRGVNFDNHSDLGDAISLGMNTVTKPSQSGHRIYSPRRSTSSAAGTLIVTHVDQQQDDVFYANLPNLPRSPPIKEEEEISFTGEEPSSPSVYSLGEPTAADGYHGEFTLHSHAPVKTQRVIRSSTDEFSTYL